MTRAVERHEAGCDHPDVADSLNNLAILRRDQGREAEAEELQTRVREVDAARGSQSPVLISGLLKHDHYP